MYAAGCMIQFNRHDPTKACSGCQAKPTEFFTDDSGHVTCGQCGLQMIQRRCTFTSDGERRSFAEDDGSAYDSARTNAAGIAAHMLSHDANNGQRDATNRIIGVREAMLHKIQTAVENLSQLGQQSSQSIIATATKLYLMMDEILMRSKMLEDECVELENYGEKGALGPATKAQWEANIRIAKQDAAKLKRMIEATSGKQNNSSLIATCIRVASKLEQVTVTIAELKRYSGLDIIGNPTELERVVEAEAARNGMVIEHPSDANSLAAQSVACKILNSLEFLRAVQPLRIQLHDALQKIVVVMCNWYTTPQNWLEVGERCLGAAKPQTLGCSAVYLATTVFCPSNLRPTHENLLLQIREHATSIALSTITQFLREILPDLPQMFSTAKISLNPHSYAHLIMMLKNKGRDANTLDLFVATDRAENVIEDHRYFLVRDHYQTLGHDIIKKLGVYGIKDKEKVVKSYVAAAHCMLIRFPSSAVAAKIREVGMTAIVAASVKMQSPIPLDHVRFENVLRPLTGVLNSFIKSQKDGGRGVDVPMECAQLEARINAAFEILKAPTFSTRAIQQYYETFYPPQVEGKSQKRTKIE